jgi:hypothetical protein
MRPKWIGTGCLALALSVAAVTVWGAPRYQQQQNQPYTAAEYAAYQAAHNENNAQSKIKLLDDFVVNYPGSALLQDAYRDEYMTYFSLGNYPQTVEYADKFLALAEKIDSGDRLEALITQAEAFLAGCVDAALRTPEAYKSAKAAATQGLQVLTQLPKPPDCIRPGPCQSERDRIQSLFNSEAGIAELGLKANSVESCKGPGSPALFDHVIDNIKQQERQSPRVR